jgi:hypothetical protein
MYHPKGNIVTWLESCRKESVTHSLLRETITQYINLINHLTGKSMSQVTNKEIAEFLIRDNEHLKSAYIIKGLIRYTEEIIISDFFSGLQISDPNWQVEISEKISKKYSGFCFRKNEWQHCRIRYEFQRANTEELYYGVNLIGQGKETPVELKQALEKEFAPAKVNQAGWCDVKAFEYRDWNNSDTMMALKHGEVLNLIKSQLSEISDRLEQIENSGLQL